MLIRFRITITYIKSALKNRVPDTTGDTTTSTSQTRPTYIFTYLYPYSNRPACQRGKHLSTTKIRQLSYAIQTRYRQPNTKTQNSAYFTIPLLPDIHWLYYSRHNCHQKSPLNSLSSFPRFTCSFFQYNYWNLKSVFVFPRHHTLHTNPVYYIGILQYYGIP